MAKVLIYVDPDTPDNSIEILGAAALLGDSKIETYAVCFNGSVAINGYFDYWISVNNRRINKLDFINIVGCLTELQKVYRFDYILIPATFTGRQFAPGLAMNLHTGLVADVTDIGSHKGETIFIRPAFDGKIMAGIAFNGNKPAMATIRAGVFKSPACQDKPTTIIEHVFREIEPSVELLDVIPKTTPVDIRESNVLISGGGGAVDCFPALEDLSKELNGMVSASRRVVDSGIRTRAVQVGQSGKTVSPGLYMAFGIYGSLQHIEGLKDAKHIISVNTNKDAPICSLSDVIVEGDAANFAAKLTKKIREKKIK